MAIVLICCFAGFTFDLEKKQYAFCKFSVKYGSIIQANKNWKFLT